MRLRMTSTKIMDLYERLKDIGSLEQFIYLSPHLMEAPVSHLTLHTSSIIVMATMVPFTF